MFNLIVAILVVLLLILGLNWYLFRPGFDVLRMERKAYGRMRKNLLRGFRDGCDG